MTDFLYTDARWTEHFVEVSDPHKEGHHVRFYFERPWVGLTDDEIWEAYMESPMELDCSTDELYALARTIEAKLKDKNL